MSFWIVGAGRMAKSYSAVLKDLGVAHQAVCRSAASAEAFTEATGAPAFSGGIDKALADGKAPSRAIVAIDVDQLAPVTARLIEAGCRSILVEKPGGVDRAEIEALAALAQAKGADVRLAYNRRFYASILAAEQQIAEDGGAVSMTFEFTEVSDVVAGLPYAPRVKSNWLLANSTHVIDTAFFLCGGPARFAPFTAGAIDWHPKAARFAGAGLTDRGVMFSYSADWDAPGRWGIEVNTRKSRLVLRPMEKLQIQRRGSFSIEPVTIDDALDTRFKPGLHRQTEAFLKGDGGARLLTLTDHAARVRTIYDRMYGNGSVVETSHA